MSDASAATVKPARNMKPMAPIQRPAPLPQSVMPAQTLREAAPRKLKPSSFQGSEFARARFDAVMPAEWDFEEALRPAFWSYVVHEFKRNQLTGGRDRVGAFIDLGTEDHAFYAQLYVRGTTTDGLIVQCIGPSVDPKTGKTCPVNLKTGMPWAGRKYDILWNDEKRGFDVVLKANGEVVADGAQFPTAELAVNWAVNASKAA
jgi:hypothetical protein